MAKKRVSRAVNNIVGGLTPFIPLLLTVGAGMIAINYIKSSGGIGNLFKGWLAGDDERERSKTTTENALRVAEKILETKGLQPNALHTTQANSIFELFNKPVPSVLWSLFTGFELSKETSKEIFDIYNGVKYTADDALIYVQYGRRKAEERTVLFTSDTEGDLRDHVTRWMHSDYKPKMLALIDRAIKAYLT
jgi:hypothetical protein